MIRFIKSPQLGIMFSAFAVEQSFAMPLGTQHKFHFCKEITAREEKRIFEKNSAMEITIEIEDRRMYNTFMQLFKKLGIPVNHSGEEKNKNKKELQFKALRLKTKGKKFNREEANAR